MNHVRGAFTLVEVAVAGSLIGLCVLTAVAIIPPGLRIQNEARMRAVAAATVMTLSQRVGFGTSITTAGAMSDATGTLNPKIIAWDSNNASLTRYDTGLGQSTLITAPDKIYQISPLPAATTGDLTRRLIFTTVTGRSGMVITWLLSKDPTDSKMRATYLATFTENI